MSEAKHALCDWKFLPEFGRVESEKRIICYIARGTTASEMEESLGNGKLIAAAPELRAACEAGLDELIGLGSYLAALRWSAGTRVILENLDSLVYKMNDVRAKLEAAIRESRPQ